MNVSPSSVETYSAYKIGIFRRASAAGVKRSDKLSHRRMCIDERKLLTFCISLRAASSICPVMNRGDFFLILLFVLMTAHDEVRSSSSVHFLEQKTLAGYTLLPLPAVAVKISHKKLRFLLTFILNAPAVRTLVLVVMSSFSPLFIYPPIQLPFVFISPFTKFNSVRDVIFHRSISKNCVVTKIYTRAAGYKKKPPKFMLRKCYKHRRSLNTKDFA